MIEIHFVRDGERWWAYTKNDRDLITAVARGKSKGKARARLNKHFKKVDYVDGLVFKR